MEDVRRRIVVREVAVVAVLALIQLGVTVGAAARHQPDKIAPGMAGAFLLALGVAAVPVRLRFPGTALAVALTTTALYWSLDYARGPVFFSLLVTFAYAVLIGRRRAAIASLVVGFFLFEWLGWVLGREPAPGIGNILGLLAWLIALFSITELARSRRERMREEARSAAEAVRRQAADERMRMARELHDAVAHNMSLINIQAGVALHLFDERPEQARDALAAIKSASKDALVELRSILGVLRQVDASDDEDAPRAPTPTLARVDELVNQAALAGVSVQLDVDGDLSHLPRGADLAAYRIVQESLTNVARHSDRPDAVVRIRAGDGTLTVEVLDEGSGRRPVARDLPSGGNGIAGMRERAASVGGRLSVGPRPGRGFAVRADLPLPAEDAHS